MLNDKGMRGNKIHSHLLCGYSHLSKLGRNTSIRALASIMVL